VSFLLVGDPDARIFAEFERLEDALEALEQLRERSDAGADVILARFDDRQGEIVGTKSVVTMRVGI
jgi:hypothetical protein